MFKTARQLVKCLQGHPDVVGLIEYGSARYQDDHFGGDYDLIVVLPERDLDVESLHFQLAGLPVDLNLRSLEDLRSLTRADGFDAVLLEGRIIHDPSGQVGRELRELGRRHEQTSAPQMTSGRVAAMRHGARHTFDKIRNGRHADTTLGRYMLHQLVYWALPQYFEVRGLPYQGEKQALASLGQMDPELHGDFREFYGTVDWERQVELARRIEEQVLAPVDGLWQDGEVLVFGDREKGMALFRRLLGIAASEGRPQVAPLTGNGIPRRKRMNSSKNVPKRPLRS